MTPRVVQTPVALTRNAMDLWKSPPTLKDVMTCARRTVRRQVIHALGLAGLQKIYRAGAGKGPKSRVRCV